MKSELRKTPVSEKRALEQELFTLISNYEKKTGLSVTEITLERANIVAELGESGLAGVYVRVELVT